MAYRKNPRVQDFIRTIRSECRKCNIRFVLSTGYQINTLEAERCQGIFEPPDHTAKSTAAARGALKVATGGRRTSEWLFSLAHEYAHFRQWMRDDPVFNEPDYYTLEAATEAEALEICCEFRLPIPRRVLLKEKKNYLRRLKAGTV